MDFAPRQNFDISAAILETTLAHAGLLGSPKPVSSSGDVTSPEASSAAGATSAPNDVAPAPAVPAVRGE